MDASSKRRAKRKAETKTTTKETTSIPPSTPVGYAPSRAGGKPPKKTPIGGRRFDEYPPRSDPRGFVLHHYRKFTGYISAAVCGADRFKSPTDVWREWMLSFDEAVADAERRSRLRIPAIAAGHYWEEHICSLAALHVFKKPYATGRFRIRTAGPVPDGLIEDVRATADAFLCEPDGTAVHPPVVIEAKYSTRSFPHRPHVAHLFQLHHQMYVLRTQYIYIAYGHGLDATEANDYRDAREFRVRVFRVAWSDALWTWMSERRNLFRALVARREQPCEENGLPRLHDNFEALWVRKEPDQSGLLPPEPRWTEVCESPSYTLGELQKLPKRLPAIPNLPDLQ